MKIRLGKREYLLYKGAAHILVDARLRYFNSHYNFPYNRITIRNQRSRWGSCSTKRNLSFNFRILFLQPEEQDYIIVHEICHLAQMNHSAQFWALVAEQVPNHKEIRSRVRKFRL